jgi:hypothetical protein
VPPEAVVVVGPEPEEEEPDRPRKRKGMKTADRMERVLLGLGFHYAKLMCFLGAMIVMLVSDLLLRFTVSGAMASAGAGNVQGTQTFVSAVVIIMVILGIVLLLTMLVTPALGFAGSLLCLWAPKKTGPAGPLIRVSFGLDAGAIGLMIVSIVLQFTSAGGRGFVAVGVAGVAGLMALGSVLLAFTAWILFMLFLRALALFLEDQVTAEDAVEVMTLLIVAGPGILVGFVVLLILLATTPDVARYVLGFVGILWAILMIKLLLRALALIATIRQHIATRY